MNKIFSTLENPKKEKKIEEKKNDKILGKYQY